MAAPYTEKQLLAEADRLSRQPMVAGLLPAGQRRAMRTAPKPDGTGVDVALAGLPETMTDAQAKSTIPALRSQLPVSFSRMDLPSFTSRYFDNASFLGGALIQNGGIACSSGFGVTGNNGAGTYLLTAAHCGEGTWTTGTVRAADGTLLTVTIGNTISAGRNAGRDVELILSPAGHGIYWGASINPPTSAGSNTYVNASGNTMNLPGAVICQSGAFSGTLCNAQIASVNKPSRSRHPKTA